MTAETGLSRYFDLGEGPAPEVVAAEHDAHGRTDYDLVRQYFRTHKVTDYDVTQYYNAATDQLTPLFYKGDRSMRESGFDPSSRFGPFSVDIIHYNPVCLNSLLYLMETQTAEILRLLQRDADAALWRERARQPRRAGQPADVGCARRAVLRLRFRPRPSPALSVSHHFLSRCGLESRARNKPLGGGEPARGSSARAALQTSQFSSGDQWDAPFGWAPLEWIAVEGLRRYGYSREADRISEKFLSLVLREFW